jgi:hypothetical protein
MSGGRYVSRTVAIKVTFSDGTGSYVSWGQIAPKTSVLSNGLVSYIQDNPAVAQQPSMRAWLKSLVAAHFKREDIRSLTFTWREAKRALYPGVRPIFGDVEQTIVVNFDR